ncbi:MAG: DEAD/DEAH box helicase, partial [Pseudomonas sp.]
MTTIATAFATLPLSAAMLANLDALGYAQMTPIQAQSLPVILKGMDLIAQAKTGSGKTAAFGIGLLNPINPRYFGCQALVLCPTRELAAQVAENFEKYSKHVKLSMALLIGGVSFKDQDKLIDRGVDVLIATPGRLLDHFERGKLMLTGVQIMVVDEADRMLDMGFIPDIERIFKMVPFTRQTL